MKMLKPKDVDSYINNSSKEAQPKLGEIRDIIKSTIPEAKEKIWYGVPFYDYYGELAGFAAYKKHVSFGFGADVLQKKDREILEKQGYNLGKGTMNIKFDQEMPIEAIKKIRKKKAKINEEKKK